MESVDMLVYQMEDDDDSIKLNAIRKLRVVACSSQSMVNFPVRNGRRFLNCVRRRLSDPNHQVAQESRTLVCDLIAVMGKENLGHLNQIVLPQLLQLLPIDVDWDDEIAFSQSNLHVFWVYAKHLKDLRPILDVLMNQGLNHHLATVREAVILGLKHLLQLHIASLGPTCDIDFGMLVEILIPSMEDDDESIVVAAEEVLGWIQSQVGTREFSMLTQRLDARDRAILVDHKDYISKFNTQETPTPRQDNQLQFGLVPKWIVDDLSSSTATLVTKLAAASLLRKITEEGDILSCRWQDFLVFLLSLCVVLKDDPNYSLAFVGLECVLFIARAVGGRIHNATPHLAPVMIELMANIGSHDLLLDFWQTLFKNDRQIHLKFIPSFRHHEPQIREQGCKVLIMSILSHPDEPLPISTLIDPLACLLCDPSASVRHVALECCAVMKQVCHCDVLTHLQMCQVENLDWFVIRSRLLENHIPILANKGELLDSRTSTNTDIDRTSCHDNSKIHLWLPKDDKGISASSSRSSPEEITRSLAMLKQKSLQRKNQVVVRKASTPIESGEYSASGEREQQLKIPASQNNEIHYRNDSQEQLLHDNIPLQKPRYVHPDDRPIRTSKTQHFETAMDHLHEPIKNNVHTKPKMKELETAEENISPRSVDPQPESETRQRIMTLATRKRLEAKLVKEAREAQAQPPSEKHESILKTGDELKAALRAGKQEYYTITELRSIPLKTTPKAELNNAIQEISSSDWETVFEGLTDLRRVAIHAPSALAGQLTSISSSVAKQINNLRSSIAKNAMLAIETLCLSLTRKMDSEIDEIATVLLKRAADTNAFLSEAAIQTLDAVCQGCSPSKLFAVFVPYTSSKNYLIRKQAAVFLGKLISIEAEANRLESCREFDRVISTLCSLIGDSNNEVRDVAKPIIIFLKNQKHVDSARLKRAVPAAILSRAEQVLQSSISIVNETAIDKPVVKSKHKPSSSGSSGQSVAITDKMTDTQNRLESNNWKDRFDGLNELKDLLIEHGSTLCQSGKHITLFDYLNKRLEDGNAKVSVLALEVLVQVIPILANGLEGVLANVAPILARNTAANNPKICILAENALLLLCSHVDSKSVCAIYSAITKSANSKVKPIMIKMLYNLSTTSTSNQSALNRYIVPTAYELMRESKTDIRDATNKLLRALYATLGKGMLDLAYKLPRTHQDKLSQILGISLTS